MKLSIRHRPATRPKGGQFSSNNWDYPEKGIGSAIVINSTAAADINSDVSSVTDSTRDMLSLTSLKSHQQLDFSTVGLYGRQKEKDALDACFEQSKTSKQLLLLSGPPGSGKSALVNHYIMEKKNQPGAVYAAGKFSANKASFGEVLESCQSICTQLLRANHSLDEICFDLVKGLGDSDTEVIAQLVPSIRDILCRGAKKSRAA